MNFHKDINFPQCVYHIPLLSSGIHWTTKAEYGTCFTFISNTNSVHIHVTDELKKTVRCFGDGENKNFI